MSIQRVQVLGFDDFGPRLPDGKWKYPNPAQLVLERLMEQRRGISRELSEAALSSVDFEAATIPTTYERPDVMEARVRDQKNLMTLIVGKALVPPLLGVYEVMSTNRFKWSSAPGAAPVERSVSTAYAPDAQLWLTGAQKIAEALAAAHPESEVGTLNSAGEGPCNEALFLATARQMKPGSVRSFPEKELSMRCDAPVGLFHIPGFVVEDRGEERKEWFINAGNNRERLAEMGITDPETRVTVGSVADIVAHIRRAVLPAMVRQYR